MMNLRALNSIIRHGKATNSLNRIRTNNSAICCRQQPIKSYVKAQASFFSTDKKKKDSLHDTINRLKGEEGEDSKGSSSSSSTSTNEVFHKFSDAMSSFSSEISSTWDELLESNKNKDINKSLYERHESKPGSTKDDDNEAADKYEGTTAVMVIDEEEHLNTYERMQRRLSEAPIIQDILSSSQQIYEKSGAKEAKEKLDDVKDDAREAWETSQNPWVYRVSSVYDTFTEESEDGMAERELRELDPTFSLHDWKDDLMEVTLPKIMQMFLEGRIKELKPFLGEAVYNRLAAEARARKKEGVYVDTNILGIMNLDILHITKDHVNKGSPFITVYFMCQQINCVRKKKTEEITEGSEDDIRAYHYTAVFQREYDEEKGELRWKVVDFMLNGATAYL